jgi:hypothetical protein
VFLRQLAYQSADSSFAIGHGNLDMLKIGNPPEKLAQRAVGIEIKRCHGCLARHEFGDRTHRGCRFAGAAFDLGKSDDCHDDVNPSFMKTRFRETGKTRKRAYRYRSASASAIWKDVKQANPLPVKQQSGKAANPVSRKAGKHGFPKPGKLLLLMRIYRGGKGIGRCSFEDDAILGATERKSAMSNIPISV